MKFVPARTESNRIHWCGPYALAVVSGQSYDEAYKRVLRRVNRKRRIKKKFVQSLSDFHLQECAKMFGTPLNRIHTPPRKRLTTILDHLRRDSIYIVSLLEHFVVVDMRDQTIIDNQSKAWEDVNSSKHRLLIVYCVYKVRRSKV